MGATSALAAAAVIARVARGLPPVSCLRTRARRLSAARGEKLRDLSAGARKQKPSARHAAGPRALTDLATMQPLLRRQHHRHLEAFHARRLLDLGDLLEVVLDPHQ